MSEGEGFLTRWSRRKRHAKEDLAAPVAEAPTPSLSAEPAPSIQDAPLPQQSVASAPGVDLTKLPALESITAGTDIRDFLAAGVPEALKRAALRRAWAADPAIRDFVGLAENTWDFTAPDSIHGFGPMAATDDVAGMAAQITRSMERPRLPIEEAEAPSRAAESVIEPGLAESSTDVGTHSAMTTKSDIREKSNYSVAAVAVDESSTGEEKVVDIAMQNEPISDPAPARRGHGGALPQ